MPTYTSGALLSDSRLTGHMGASTNGVIPTLSALVLNREGVNFANLPALEMPGTDEISSTTSINTPAEVNPWEGAWLPALLVSAQGETFVSSIAGGMKLSTLTASSISVGLVLGEDISVPTISATGSFIQPADLDAKISELSLSASTGVRCGDLKLSTAELEISILGDLVGRLDRTIPGLTLSSAGSGGLLGSLTKDLPPLSLSISVSTVDEAVFSKNIPALMLSAAGSLNNYGNFDVDLPSLIISDGEGHGSSMSLDAKVSTLLTQIIGSGVSGDGSGSIASNSSRFTDYSIRNSR